MKDERARRRVPRSLCKGSHTLAVRFTFSMGSQRAE